MYKATSSMNNVLFTGLEDKPNCNFKNFLLQGQACNYSIIIIHNDLPKQRDRMVDTLNSLANADSLLQD